MEKCLVKNFDIARDLPFLTRCQTMNTMFANTRLMTAKCALVHQANWRSVIPAIGTVENVF